jgi:FkbM family methyltransferase
MLLKLRLSIIRALIDLNERFIFERKLKNFYQRKDFICSVIDVGANKGQTIDFFLKLNPRCNIYSFEPNPKLFNFLQKKYEKFPNVKIFNLGISNLTGEKLFYENLLDYTSSFEPLNPESEYLAKKARILGTNVDQIVVSEYKVETIRLSDFINNSQISNIDVIKIDTEGHEYSCLHGLFNELTLPKIKYIQIENHNHNMYLEGSDYNAITTLLNSNDFYEAKFINHGFGNFNEIIFNKK